MANATLLKNEITNSVGIAFILIPAGTFAMGSPASEPNADKTEQPAHDVTISQPFYLGKHPVTQAQWAAVMASSPSRVKTGWQRLFSRDDDAHPVAQVSWHDAQAFLAKLNALEGVRDYRLPTEAEWEYACRAGSSAPYPFGDKTSQLGKYAWYLGNSHGKTHAVGRKKPNAWGLYDMLGNVWEWVQDWYGPYPAEAVCDPGGRKRGEYRVLRGGSCRDRHHRVRSAYRLHLSPSARHPDYGFRIAFRAAGLPV